MNMYIVCASCHVHSPHIYTCSNGSIHNGGFSQQYKVDLILTDKFHKAHHSSLCTVVAFNKFKFVTSDKLSLTQN